jgi:hypothetical protein
VVVPLLVGVEDGFVSDAAGALSLEPVEACAPVLVPAPAPALDALAGSGVGCGVAGGGWTAVAGLEPAATSDGSSGVSSPTANDALGAGPIAAPTATPIASIAAASAAVTRGDGARKEDFWLSGVLFIESGGFLGKPKHG